MIDSDGYFDWADRDIKLPHDHRWYDNQPVDIVVCHSLEGATNYWFFLDPNAPPWKGWHATVTYEGVLRQHAPIWWGLAHGGDANPHGPGIESEGFWNEPLTEMQVKTWQRILKDLAAWKGRPYTRSNGKLTEHREWSDTYCPSERYAPLYAALKETKAPPPLEQEDDMTPEQVREICRELLEDHGPGIVRQTVQAMVENREVRDVRLRESQKAQDALMHLASDVDVDRQMNAVQVLKDAGFKL